MERADGSASAGRAGSLSAPDGSAVRQASGEHAATYIRRLIFDGELQQGTRLPQDQIARALGVSRIPVREAVVALEREGWVTTRLHKGAFINSFDEDTIRDHYSLFALIYGLAVRRTIARSDPDVIARLTELAHEVASTDDPATVGTWGIRLSQPGCRGRPVPSHPYGPARHVSVGARTVLRSRPRGHSSRAEGSHGDRPTGQEG